MLEGRISYLLLLTTLDITILLPIIARDSLVTIDAEAPMVELGAAKITDKQISQLETGVNAEQIEKQPSLVVCSISICHRKISFNVESLIGK